MKKYLFAVDLDGTLLKNSSTSEIDPRDIKAIERLKSAGHIVCLVTGRPWRATEHIYKKLKLDTIVANYNGAQIHNPADYGFTHQVSYMNLNDVMYILGDKRIKEVRTNLAIEGPNWVMLEKRDSDLEKVFGFKNAEKFVLGIDVYRLPLKPTGVIFDTKAGVDVAELKNYLQRKFGDLAEFSSWSKGDDLTPVFDMTNIGVTKAKVISLISRYYDMPIEQTVSIGDGYNDIPMLYTTEISVAMLNAHDDIKKHATYITKRTHEDAGVSEFINRFLENKDGFVEDLLSRRKLMTKN